MSSAPKPILIQGKEGGSSENESTTQTEAPPSTPTEPGGSTSASHPKATSNLAQVIERYETLNAQSNPSIPLSVLALVFLLGGPILAFSGLDNSVDFEDAANRSSYEKHLSKARELKKQKEQETQGEEPKTLGSSSR
ncbi:MAG: hypothetical protein ACPGMY_07815, partial [Poseidonia sp.]